LRRRPAPPVHPSVELRLDEDDPGRDVYFSLARTAERFYVRLRWRDETRDVATLHDRFRDGAAVQFAVGDEATSYIMGTGPEEPVNIWYWRSDANSVESLAAGGPGSTTRLEEQLVSGDSRYQLGEENAANQWVVVMSRPIAAEGEHQVSFERAQVPIALSYIDYDNRRFGFRGVVHTTGDVSADMDRIRAVYADIRGKFPENRSEIRLRDEDEVEDQT